MKLTTALRPALLILLFVLGLFSRTHAAPGDLDLSFDPGFGVNGPLNAVVVQPDGKVIIGGQFTMIEGLLRTNIARLNADGSSDSSFNSLSISGTVLAVALQSDGKVLVGSGTGVSRLNFDGSADSNFLPSLEAKPVDAVVTQPDGKVLIAGQFTTVNGVSRNGVARLNADGSLDTTFDPGTGATGSQGRVSSVKLQSDGKVLIGGAFSTFNDATRWGLARLNPDGSLDNGFDPDAGIGAFRDGVTSIAVQADGKVLLGGDFTFVNAAIHRGIARLNANGSLDASFNAGTGISWSGHPAVRAIGVQADGKVIIGGHFSSVNDTARNSIARLNADGSLDTSFDLGAGTYPYGVGCVAVQSDDKVLIGGSFTTINGTNRSRIARLNADGGLDGSFDPGIGLNSAISSVVALSDGKVLIGGPFTFINGTNQYGDLRLNPDGSLDTTFISDSFNPDLSQFYSGLGGSVWIGAIAVQSDGKVVVGGLGLHACDGEPGCQDLFHSFVTRLNPNGSRDPSFTSFVGPAELAAAYVPQVRSVALQPDGKVVVGYVGFGAIRGLVRLNADGTRDTNFNPSVLHVHSVVAQADGKLLIGGSFATVNGTNRNGLARLNSDGSLDGSFNPAVGGYPLALQPDGKVLVGGRARLNPDGSLDSSFNAVTVQGVRSIALHADGNVLIAGDFLTVNGVVRPYVARLYGDFGGAPNIAPTVNISSPVNGQTYAAPASVDIDVEAFDSDGTVVRVDFYADAVLIGSDAASPFEVTWNPVSAGNYSLTAVATDNLGAAATSAAVGVILTTPAPTNSEIVIEQPAGTNLVDGSASIGFGSVAPGAATDLTFTVKNTGTEDLSSIATTIEGAQASAFTVTAAPADAVAPNGSTTFTVRFAPVNRGLHSATLHVASNDADENPFDISLTGTGANGSPIAAADSATAASATVVEINVLANDSDPEGDALTITGVSNGTHGIAQVITTGSGQRIRYTPAATYSGTDSFTYTITDGFGGNAVGAVSVTVSKAKGKRVTKRYSKGGSVPGANDPMSGVPAGAVWKSFGVPSMANDGSVAFTGAMATSEGVAGVVYVGNGGDEEAAGRVEYLMAKKGDPAPGVGGATFNSFKDPLLNNDGTVIFLARTRGGDSGAASGIWRHYAGQGAAASTLVVRSGGEAAGVSGARWKAFTSVAVSDGAPGEELIAFTARMAAGSGGVRADNDFGLWIAHAGGVTLALREGASVSIDGRSTRVKSLVALQALPGAHGQGGGATASGVLVRVKLADRTESILRITVDGDGLQASIVASAGDAIEGAGASLASFGSPAQSSDGRAAFIATLSGSSAESNTAIIQTNGSDHQLIAREGEQPLAGDSAALSAFSAVVNDSSGRVAFTAQLRGNNVSRSNNCAIFLRDGGALQLIARKDDQPPGVPAGAAWASFPSLALPDAASGPLFIGKLLVPRAGKANPAGITSRNNTGLWSSDSTGALQLIVRTGDPFDAQRKITALTLLSYVPGSPTQARSFTDAGAMIYRATLSDGSQHIVTVELTE